MAQRLPSCKQRNPLDRNWKHWSADDLLPLRGHNAFLRWSALQHQALENEGGKVWSEEHVSEDFVMTLCLNRAGYITRWATYSQLGYKEGVSLTCDDELNRWQK